MGRIRNRSGGDRQVARSIDAIEVSNIAQTRLVDACRIG
jgi:hypothetical protein